LGRTRACLEGCRCLDDYGRLKTGYFHPSDRVTGEVIDQIYPVKRMWSDEDVCTARILSSEPLERRVDLIGAPAFAQQHPGIRQQHTDVEAIASHRCELLSDYDTCDRGAHHW